MQSNDKLRPTLLVLPLCTLVLSQKLPPVPILSNSRIQGLWNRVLDECAEKQRASGSRGHSLPPSGVGLAGDDSRGETSEESHGEGSSSAESEAAEPDDAIRTLTQVGVHRNDIVASSGAQDGDGGPGQEPTALLRKGKAGGQVDRAVSEKSATGAGFKARNPVSLGSVLEETAHDYISSFSSEEMDVWNWHRGNLEISCGAVSDSRTFTVTVA